MNQHRKGNAFQDRNTPGDPRLLDAITRRTPVGVNQQVTHTYSGTILTPKKQRRFTATPLKPLTLKNGTSVDKFQIVPGTVNSEMPTLGGTDLDDGTPPEFTVTADTYVWLKCVGTFGSPDTYVVTVETSATIAVPSGTSISETGFTSFFYIGWIDFTSGSPDAFEINNSYTGGNLGIESFGNVNLWWRS